MSHQREARLSTTPALHPCSVLDSCYFKALRKIIDTFKSCLEQVVPFQVQLNYFGKERVSKTRFKG